MTLSDLITAVERAEGPSRDIDAAVEVIFHEPPKLAAAMTPGEPGWLWATDGSQWKAPGYTASIDAVVALIRREMPGASYGFTNEPPSAVFARVNMTYGASGDADHITEALALLLAFLRAARARQENDTP